jgi:hypothetical protein
LPDPDRNRHPGPADPDLYPFQPYVKNTFLRKFQYAVQNIENYDTHDTYGIDERNRTMLPGIVVNK